jgi:Nidogen-like/PEP-CTERM motif
MNATSLRQSSDNHGRLVGRFGAVVGAVLLGAAAMTQAAVIVIPNSALVPSTQLYTDVIGGGIGNPLLMTGGGNAANVGQSRNDDGFSGPINFGFNFTLFGTTYTQFWANNNGNISFGNGIAAFTPTGLQGSNTPLISPFFGDVDTRNLNSGVMSLRLVTDANGDQIIVTWPTVGVFSNVAPPTNTFQLVVRADDYDIPTGQGQVGMFWGDMDWEVGSASGGNGVGFCNGTGGIGLGCVPAAVGFGDGQNNGFVLQGSTLNGISNIVEDHQLWFTLVDGVPTVPPGTVPEPGSLLLSALALGLVATLRRRRNDRS